MSLSAYLLYDTISLLIASKFSLLIEVIKCRKIGKKKVRFWTLSRKRSARVDESRRRRRLKSRQSMVSSFAVKRRCSMKSKLYFANRFYAEIVFDGKRVKFGTMRI